MKQWQKPKLAILVRNNPKEEILSACKYDTAASNPVSGFVGCRPPPFASCDSDCAVYASS